MNIQVDIQNPNQYQDIPSRNDFERWVEAGARHIAAHEITGQELVIRIVDNNESQALNAQFRQKNKPTNVLSFYYDDNNQSSEKNINKNIKNNINNHLGDLIICKQVVSEEARQQHKEEQTHWAHLVIHGLLHLLGYDHQTEQEASEMESLEINILSSININNPYEIHQAEGN